MFNFDKKCNSDLKELRDEFYEYKKEQTEKINKLRKCYDAKIFELKFPNGLVRRNINYYGIFVNRYVENENIVYAYASCDEIEEIKLTYLNEELDAYKICNNNDVIYIGVRSENEEKYFVVDIGKKLSIEIEKSGLDELNKLEWVNN